MNRFRVLVLSPFLLAAFGLALLPVYSRADAAAETPPGLAASPRQNSVEWVVRSDVFESNYRTASR